MKISKIHPETPVVANSVKTEKKPSAALDFQNLLEEAQAKTKDSGSTPYPASLGELRGPIQNPLFPAQVRGVSPGLENATEARFQGIRLTEKVLELLEGYQKSMANPKVSLKEIDPMIQSLSKGIDTLDTLSKDLPPADPLQRILTEVGIISTIEVERFKRGEYL